MHADGSGENATGNDGGENTTDSSGSDSAAGASPVESSEAAGPRGPLARTGSEPLPLAALLMVTIGLGVAMLARSRRV